MRIDQKQMAKTCFYFIKLKIIILRAFFLKTIQPGDGSGLNLNPKI